MTWRWRKKACRWLEGRGWLPPYGRLVVICGMARTGTTALAAYMGSHPDVRLVVGGPLWHRLESDYVRREPDWGFVDGLLDEVWPAMVLLKQPWLERNKGFFDKAKGAKVLVCTRDPETLFQSWMGPGRSFVGDDCKRKPGEAYAMGMFPCLRMMMRGAMEVRMEEMLPGLEVPLGRFVGIDPKGFDGARLAARWQGALEKKWVEEHAVWRDKR